MWQPESIAKLSRQAEAALSEPWALIGGLYLIEIMRFTAVAISAILFLVDAQCSALS